MRKKLIAALMSAALAVLACGNISVQAAVTQDATATAYDKAVDLVDNMNGLGVVVKETIGFPNEPDEEKSVSTAKVKASGLQKDGELKASIAVTAVDGKKHQYYTDGYYYSNQTGKNMKYAMTEDVMKEMLNFYIYLNLNSEYLSSLTSSKASDGTVTYSFTATEETIGDYADKILAGTSEADRIKIESISGTMTVDAQGLIQTRKITTAYETGTIQPIELQATTDATFKKTGDSVTVKIPDLSAYKEKGKTTASTATATAAAEPVTSITPLSQTVYATTGVNVRAQNNISATILGGASTGEALMETGYTSDGWTQISYNGSTGYVKSDYISTTKPIIETAMSATMYAACSVHVRDGASTQAGVLGSLGTGDSVQAIAYTDNNWIKVSYNGNNGYVYADYLLYNDPTDTSDNTMNDEYYYDTSDNTMDDEYDTSDNTMNDEPMASEMGTCIALGMSTITVAMDDGRVLTAEKENINLYWDTIYEGAPCLVYYYGDEILAIGY